jgi:hypothetical protein
VGGEDDADLVVGHGLHQYLQELAPGQGVEAGHRLVEDQELGPFGHGQGQGELGPLAARELAGPLGRVEPELVDPGLGHLLIPTGLRWAPSWRWSATVSPE